MRRAFCEGHRFTTTNTLPVYDNVRATSVCPVQAPGPGLVRVPAWPDVLKATKLCVSVLSQLSFESVYYMHWG